MKTEYIRRYRSEAKASKGNIGLLLGIFTTNNHNSSYEFPLARRTISRVVPRQMVGGHCDNDIKRATSGYQHFTDDISLTTTCERHQLVHISRYDISSLITDKKQSSINDKKTPRTLEIDIYSCILCSNMSL